ncbi:MAG TPA: DUF1800 domain-containing protein [Pyrinomonadaceae bacterium]|jgi:uncharacterized protein (DUF1800 family)|nr:DUF1800 domain-containing protein [Pyrinomonadaceae bacterium]
MRVLRSPGIFACALALWAAVSASAQTAPGGPVLLTEGTGLTTRAVAYEAVTHRPEPFPVVSPFNWNADKSNTRDQQTRVTVFAMNLGLLPNEGAGALSADAQDSAGRLYPLKVEALGQPVYVKLKPVPGNPSQQQFQDEPQGWLYAVTLRLDDSMTDTLGDVLVRINLHGLSSNRARIAVGQTGPGPAADPSTEVVSPAPAAEPPPAVALTPKAFGPNESNDADVTRLLEQATFGPTTSEVARVRAMGIRAFVEEQLNATPLNPSKGSNFFDLEVLPDDSQLEGGCPATRPSVPNYIQSVCQRDKYTIYPVQVQFFRNAIALADSSDPQGSVRRQNQLRQRVAFALHQIFVVSNREIGYGFQMMPYLQALDRGAFGNFRTLLGEITLNPAMGEYLNMNQSTAASPNENYAREILQLFSVGVNQLNLDGTPVLDAQGNPVPAYTQTTVDNFTRVFTGWRFATALQAGNPPAGATNYRDPMVPRNGTTHDTGAKNLFGTVLAGCPGATGTLNGQCAQTELNAALDVIFNHPNVGPFIGKQLIQHLVTSNPSPAYVARVARAFNNDCDALYADGCTGVRGNMKAVARAVVLDPEARGDLKNASDYGRLREPAQYVSNILKAFNSISDGVLGTCVTRPCTDWVGLLDQPVFQPPTVFGYYAPDYEVPGTKTLGPAFQINYTTTTLRRANFADRLIYIGLPFDLDHPTGTTLTWAELDAVWLEPDKTDDERFAKFIGKLDSLLLHGTMTPQMRAIIKTAIQAVPANDARRRSQSAAYLILTSPHYEVQR